MQLSKISRMYCRDLFFCACLSSQQLKILGGRKILNITQTFSYELKLIVYWFFDVDQLHVEKYLDIIENEQSFLLKRRKE